jgi:ribosomal protein L11 methylase PrmA
MNESSGDARIHPASFRDPSAFLFESGGVLYRWVGERAADDYRLLMDSGLYTELVEESVLVDHEELGRGESTALQSRLRDKELGGPTHVILRPRRLPFISYPYEWSFQQLKHAALVTLHIQRRALARDLSLKDASAYNVQFDGVTPVLIDTLSFERYVDGRPWVAYRQFCQHFLAPLALMAYRDIRWGLASREHIDGLPLDFVAASLPRRTRLRPGLVMHLHGHAASQKRHAAAGSAAASTSLARRAFSRRAMEGLLDSLEGAVRALRWKREDTEWAEYYDDTNYSGTAEEHKARVVRQWVGELRPRKLWDLGANDGRYSRVAKEGASFVLSADGDPVAVDRNYRQCRAEGQKGILPLLVDLFNPSPALGWEHNERMSLLQRGPADMVLALALMHHLCISNNVSFDRLVSFFARCAETLLIEWVPKGDSQVQRLLATREDIFDGYGREAFENAFGARFSLLKREEIPESKRSLYLYRRLS